MQYKKKVQKFSITNKVDSNFMNSFLYHSIGNLFYSKSLNLDRINMLPPNILKYELGQSVTAYIFYALLSLIQYQEFSNEMVTKTVPIGLAIGSPIMIGDMTVAGSVNKKFQAELTDYDLNGKKN